MIRLRRAAAAALLASLALGDPAGAHPHVFIDTEIDFSFADGRALEAVRITWRFDEFESLYTLSADGIDPDVEGPLDPEAQQILSDRFVDWDPSFDGFARLTVGLEPIKLGPPTGLSISLEAGRLTVRFERALTEPIPLEVLDAEVAVYEDTYYYALAVTEEPRLIGSADGCQGRVIPFEPNAELTMLQTSLFDLGREETPTVANVGALFADRIVVSCGQG